MQTSGGIRRENANLYPGHCERRAVGRAKERSDVPTIHHRARSEMVGTLRFAHPTAWTCYPSLNSSYPFAATSSHLAR